MWRLKIILHAMISFFYASIETRSDSKNNQPTNLPIQRISDLRWKKKMNVKASHHLTLLKLVKSCRTKRAHLLDTIAMCMNFAGKYPIASLICRYYNLSEEKNIWCRKKNCSNFEKRRKEKRIEYFGIII